MKSNAAKFLNDDKKYILKVQLKDKIEKIFNDATKYYSEFDHAMDNLSAQLFNLAPKLAVDYYLTKNLHNIEDLNACNVFYEYHGYYQYGDLKNHSYS